jgi:predicted transcriptional regulator
VNNDTGIGDYVGLRRCLGGQSLGELEAQIMDIIWDLKPPVTAANVFKVMYPKRELSYSTVMLTMAKLARKGFLKQRRSGPKKTDAFYYTPAMTREQMGRRLLDAISEKIFHKSFVQALMDLAK